jgi:protein-disulfide isomerase
VSELGSAAVPPEQPQDHVRGNGPEVTLYLDLACPACASTWARVRELPLRLCVRHFPVASRRPRSPALHAAAEAAASQAGEEAFWAMWDSLYEDRGRTDDPHLWARAERLGLDLARFEADRRSDAVEARVQRDFRGGIRAGVVGTPTAFREGRPISGGNLAEALAALARG